MSEPKTVLNYPTELCKILLPPSALSTTSSEPYQQKMPKVYIREATLADIPRLAHIWAIALNNDSFYDVIYPRRREFFNDYRDMWVSRLRTRFLQPGERYIVAETDVEEANGRSRKEIVGWGSWIRMGSSEAAKKAMLEGESVLKDLERRLFGLEESFIHPLLKFIRRYPGDRFADAKALEEFYRDYPTFVGKYWAGDIEEHWHLKMLAVDPKWQRNGIGQMLVRWGLEKAQNEGVPAGLGASDAGGPMYLKLGFEEIGRFTVPGGKVTIPIMLWRSKSTEGREMQ